ncbi:MAG: hypothetical protein ABII82_20790 [Verrucomicrobiota bacterium]
MADEPNMNDGPDEGAVSDLMPPTAPPPGGSPREEAEPTPGAVSPEDAVRGADGQTARATDQNELRTRLDRLERELGRERQRANTAEGRLATLAAERRADQAREREERERAAREREERRREAHRRHLTGAEREEFVDRDSALGVPGRAVLGIVEEELGDVRREIQEWREQQRRGAATAEAKERQRAVWERVERAMPGSWGFISARREDWDQYLAGIDEVEGISRGEVLAEVLSSGKARPVLAYVREFMGGESADEGGGVKPRSVPSPLAHGQRRTGKPAYSAWQMQTLNDDLANGKYDGDPAKKAALEAEFDAAYREGRVLPDSRAAQPFQPQKQGSAPAAQ